MALAIKERRVAIAPGAYTASQASAVVTDGYKWNGIIVYLNVTAGSGTGGLKVVIRAKDVNGTSYDMTAGGASAYAPSGAGNRCYILYPGAGGAAGAFVAEIVSAPLPFAFYIFVLAGDSSSYTYSVTYDLIP